MVVQFWGFVCSADGGTHKTPKLHHPPPSPAPSRPFSPLSLCALCASVVNPQGASLAEGAFAAEQVVVVLGEPVGFVANVLQQAQRVGVPAQT